MEELLKDELGHLNLSGRVMKTEKFPRGGGGFGDIWRGRVDDAEVAIKIPKIYATHTERQTQKVAKEACMEIYTWSRLRHDNVLALLGYCFDFSTVSLISPWMANGSANDFLHANPDFPSVKLLPGITSGLCYMHDNQIVHGDLRGDNILISQDGTPRLADFGLSRELMQTLSQNPSKIAGAARWMAREYMGELNTPTKAGDVWAFGMTVLELATRKKPFHSYHNDATVILHITTGVTPSIPDASECCIGWDDELWKLCLDCWEPDPGHRPPMSSMKNRLLRFEGLESSSSEPQDQIALSIGSNPSIWPIPAFCLELEDLTVRVRATDIVYFASGGFSTVWRGAWVDPADGPPHKLALKAFLFSHLPQNRRNLEKRLKRETRLWRRLSHPHILPFLGVCYGPIPPVHDFPALISPLCENGNIVEYLSSRPEVNRISLLVQVASGLEYLHSSSVVHGDLRGSNILIKDDGEACLSDFGHSTLVASEEFDRGSGASGVQSASIRWSAPEKIKDDLDFESVPTLASDVWSFAMVILEVIDGRRPWAEIKSDLRVTLQLLQGKHPRRPVNTTISDEIWSLLERCWHPPDERPVFQTVLNDLRMIQLSYEMYH